MVGDFSISVLNLAQELSKGEQNEKGKKVEFEYKEPETLATKDVENFPVVKNRKSRLKANFELVNPFNGLNSGLGTSSWTSYNWQPISYPECAILSQNPLMKAVLNILSNLPFQGDIVSWGTERDDESLSDVYKKYNLQNTIKDAVCTAFSQGGCLLYIDFGEKTGLEEPLDLAKARWKEFKGLRLVEPLYCSATVVDTQNPLSESFMNPSEWMIAGFGRVHASRFIKIDENLQALFMRPLSMYFGFPLTHLIKGEIANASASGFHLSNLLSRFRNLYFYTPDGNYAKSYHKIIERLRNMVRFMSNSGVTPMKTTERMEQLVSPMTGLKDVVEALLLIISITVQLPLLSMMDSNKNGLSGGHENDLNIMNTRLIEIRERHANDIAKIIRIWKSFEDGKYYDGEIFPKFSPLSQSTMIAEAQAEMAIASTAEKLRNVGASNDYIEKYLVAHGDVKFDLGVSNFVEDVKDEKENTSTNKNGGNDEGSNKRKD